MPAGPEPGLRAAGSAARPAPPRGEAPAGAGRRAEPPLPSLDRDSRGRITRRCLSFPAVKWPTRRRAPPGRRRRRGRTGRDGTLRAPWGFLSSFPDGKKNHPGNLHAWLGQPGRAGQGQRGGGEIPPGPPNPALVLFSWLWSRTGGGATRLWVLVPVVGSWQGGFCPTGTPKLRGMFGSGVHRESRSCRCLELTVVWLCRVYVGWDLPRTPRRVLSPPVGVGGLEDIPARSPPSSIPRSWGSGAGGSMQCRLPLCSPTKGHHCGCLWL